ncbi:hypothetical protein FNH22_07605 [Fulvivirga sp. M361]|uniref:hypothetical protein n=1 Tax=Fulvivirga sp. M361 TaxID=2594266 RepID=UPI001179ADCD|nr:hypothetical protein [Fulvivirga sp. M361]TRX59910.1 hypothetical protein FNH22_07605 [Fulvivirga sp. M361]
MNYVLLLALNCFLTDNNLPNTTREIKFKTITIVNDHYMVADDWKDISIDLTTGEDVNSENYGGIYYPPTSHSSSLKERRISIARESMEIEIDLLNTTNDRWLLESITLNVLKVYKASEIDFETGSWEIGKRTLGYSPYFEIKDGINSITDLPTDVFIGTKKKPTDSRMILRVYAEEVTGKIYEFGFILHLSKEGNQDKKMVITSDKSYFIASN